MNIPNIETLMDEIKKATKANRPNPTDKEPYQLGYTYGAGYLDGLQMALDILEGNVE